MAQPATLLEYAYLVLTTAEPDQKTEFTFQAFSHFQAAPDWPLFSPYTPPPQAPKFPARPEKPDLISASKMPKRRKSSGLTGRIALLHAFAHIELNAIDLAWDILLRFGPDLNLPRAFYADWLQVAHDEAIHFNLLQTRLKQLGASYGDLPAHNGLWESACDTAHDLTARLAIVPMVLEARGLDVSPPTIEKLKRAEDTESANILQRIYQDEISHVAFGHKWFQYMARLNGEDPVKKWHEMVTVFFRGNLKPPFNEPARDQAGMHAQYYLPLVHQKKTKPEP